VLDLSRAEHEALAPTIGDVDLRVLVAEVVAAFEVKAQSGGVSLSHAIDAHEVRADADMLRRVLENLIDNALRHAPEQSEVRISAAVRDRHVELRVSDEGPGIPEAMRQRIFERFVQVESGDRLVSRAGQGLGLAFCRVAAEAHGGTIVVEPDDAGAVFCVRWPDDT